MLMRTVSVKQTNQLLLSKVSWKRTNPCSLSISIKLKSISYFILSVFCFVDYSIEVGTTVYIINTFLDANENSWRA